MNIRFAPQSVRLRISLDEARTLQSKRRLEWDISLPQESMHVLLMLAEDQSAAAKFSFMEQRTEVALRERDFLELLQAKPSRDSCIEVPLPARDGTTLEFVFEVDLFSRKQSKGAKE